MDVCIFSASHFCLNATCLMHNSWNALTFLSTTCDQGDRTFIVRRFPFLWRPPNDCEMCFWSPTEYQRTLLQVTDHSWMCFWIISSYIFFYFDIFVGEMRDAGMFEMSVVINSLHYNSVSAHIFVLLQAIAVFTCIYIHLSDTFI